MPNNFLSPIILPQSPGDMEEARIRRLMDLARLEQLRREPGFQERQVSLQERNAKTNETLGFANLSLDQKKAEVAKFLADNNVKHDAGALAEATRHNVATETQAQTQTDAARHTQIFGDLSRMPVDPKIQTKLLADYLAENGDPSLQKVLTTTEANKPKPQGEFGADVKATTTPYGIPNAYANDPAFAELAPLLETRKAQDLTSSQYGWGERFGAALTGRTPEEQRRNIALRQLKSRAGIYRPGIDPLYLGN